MICASSNKAHLHGGVVLGFLATCASVVWAHTITLPDTQASFVISAEHGNLASASLGRVALIADCLDEYWLEDDEGNIVERASEGEDQVIATSQEAGRITLRCQNQRLGLTITKSYAPGPARGSLRKTVTVGPLSERGLLHVFSRVRLAEESRPDALIYTPRQSWVGAPLLYGVRRLSEVEQETRSGSGWDNRFVVAFRDAGSPALAHWRAEVDGEWVPHSGVIAPWGAKPQTSLTYFPDGWRFRLLHCFEGTEASAAADYVLFNGDWYSAWALYRELPEFREAYRSLDTMPHWPRQVKYGTFWWGPDYEAFATATSQLCQRLGDDAYLTIGVFAWSLDGDYETKRPFLTETLSHVYTPSYFARCVAALQEHPRAKVGLYIQGGLIDTLSQCYQEHPDWVIYGRDLQPLDSGFADNPVGRMYIGNPRVEEWVSHHLSRIEDVCRTYDCGFIYLDGGGYGEDVDWLRRHHIGFTHHRRLNERVLATVRSTGPERALLINSQNGPYADLSWLECGYFGSEVPWRDTVDFCFDTECLQDPRYTLEPLFWSDNDRYLAMCIAFGFTPCGDVWAEKPAATWRAIEAAWEMKPGRLVLDSRATAPVWWRDGVPVVTFAERVGDELVVPILNFGDDEKVTVTVNLAAAEYEAPNGVAASLYQPLVDAAVLPVTPTTGPQGILSFDLRVPTSWRGITLLRLRRLE